MGLFDSFNPLDILLQGSQSQSNKNLANKAGLDMGDFGKIATIGLPIILSAINKNTQTPEGLDSFDNALAKHEDVKDYNSVDQLTENLDPEDGEKILGHVFEDKQTIIGRIASTLGMSEDAVKRALIVVAPLILKYMADRKKANQLDKEGLQRETSQTVEKVNSSLRERGVAPTSGGNLIDMILGDQAAEDGKNQPEEQPNMKDNILGGILDLFK
ncbi:DUF937 domain-containing protein [Facklamia miroungae]|uniref:DUF937 domain-containing protein n=1 Tax=Facklamia miroungae TaxID=120956 RepID=A0A1G7PDD5_9LACT|nr:DUF937 domain-containing protein [Facklamia miroungae]NKZ28646.1 DUF937 domain-containing protein [Facklamia miroungae]SDF83480.1 hypothetical protein SAMN05421791_101187 [Facklamia miroungae]